MESVDHGRCLRAGFLWLLDGSKVALAPPCENITFDFMYWLTRWGSSFNPPYGFHNSQFAEKWWHIRSNSL